MPPLPRRRQVTADRGIGGTGAPTIAASSATAGTAIGAAAGGVPGAAIADRGIGGTGIVGVVTGFASICVDGLEVAYDRGAPVDIDGTRIDSSWLRVGQVVAIRTAAGAAAEPVASSISVRVEITGRIERIELANGQLRIGGQPVVVSAGIPGADRFTLGDWVAVSGLRRTDGVIVASRLDATPAGRLTARGRVSQIEGGLRLGALTLPAGSARDGDWVKVSGLYSGNQPRVLSVAVDTLCADPAHCFAGAVDHVILQAFVQAESGHLRIDGMQLPVLAPKGNAPTDGFAIISLDRQPDGSFAAVGLKYTDPAHIDGMNQLDPAEPLMIALSSPHLPPPAPVTRGAAMPDASPEAIPTVSTPLLSMPELSSPGLSNQGLSNQGLFNPGLSSQGLSNPGLSAPGSPQTLPTGGTPSISDTTPPVTSGSTPNLNQLPGSPLPVLSPGAAGGVPISDNNPTSTGPFAALPRNSFIPGGTASGHAGGAIGPVMQALGSHASAPAIVSVAPAIPPTSAGAAGVMLNTGATLATPVMSSTTVTAAVKK